MKKTIITQLLILTFLYTHYILSMDNKKAEFQKSNSMGSLPILTGTSRKISKRKDLGFYNLELKKQALALEQQRFEFEKDLKTAKIALQIASLTENNIVFKYTDLQRTIDNHLKCFIATYFKKPSSTILFPGKMLVKTSPRKEYP